VNRPGDKFRDTAMVSLASIVPGSALFYQIVDSGSQGGFLPYTRPFFISRSCQVRAYAESNGIKSKIISQNMHRIPNSWKIDVISKVNPMYTAGGPEALIDGVIGTVNWRTGEWQGYYDRDFEAVVDLGQSKEIHYVGIHVLQDISPWIIYPKELQVFTSEDGIRYVEAGRINTAEKTEAGPATTKEQGSDFNTRGRFVKLIAVNGGKLPAWHESAGNGSHLFIDEIFIR
jgi:hypothetical protein